MINIRSQVRDIINKSMSYNAIDESVNLKTDLVSNQLETCYNDLLILFSSISNTSSSTLPTNPQAQPNLNNASDPSQDNHELQRKEAIQELINQIFYQKHPKKQLMLLRLITRLVNNRSKSNVEVRHVCECMLNNLVFSNYSSANANYLALLNSSSNFINNSTNSPNNFSLNNINMNNISLVQKLVQSQNLILNNNNMTQLTEFKATPTYIWCKILDCITRFIPLHDYKSCRDIFKMLLEVVKRIPHSHSSYPPQLETELIQIKSTNKHKLMNDYSSGDNSLNDETLNNDNIKSDTDLASQMSIVTDDLRLESLYQTISFLLDKENYFMPRYLAINEIKTVLAFGKEAYHQRFHDIFTKFIESFIPTAHLISISGRDRLLPIVGFSNLYSLYSFWRFNQNTCKFNTSGPLPYFKHVSKPHHEVYFYLLRQNTSQYLILSLMSLHRNIKTRLHAFEEEFANAIIETMYLTENLIINTFENLRIWNNLVNQLVNLNQIIHLPALIQLLSMNIKKKGNSFKTSRDWLMWFLLLIITSYMNRNSLPEFSDLYELLYKDDEMLPNPDLTSFTSVIKLAPLSIWIHLNLRVGSSHNLDNSMSGNTGGTTTQGPGSNSSNNSNKNSLSKISVIPEIIRNHFTLLQDRMTNQQFQDFGLSICMNAYSTDTSLFTIAFNSLLERIGKNAFLSANQQQQQHQLNGIGSPNNGSNTNTIFSNHQPLSFEMIKSFTLHVRIHIAQYLTYLLTQKTQITKTLNLNIPASIVETFARLLIFDPDNFIKVVTQNVWQVLITTNFNSLPMPALTNNQPISNMIQTTFLYQQVNLIIELICFRLKHLSFTHRTTFLFLLNNLFTSGSQLSSSNLNQQQRPDQMNFIRHPQIYINAQSTMLKLLSSFNGSDFYEFLNSIYASSKHAPKYFINPDSEEINKAIVILIARAIHLTSSDLFPLENKEKDDALRGLLREIMKTTPIYFHSYAIESFPKVIQDFFIKEQSQTKQETFYVDSSNKTYKLMLKKKVDEDYKRFLECRHETQAQAIFQNNPISAHTLLCIMFNLLQDESAKPNMSTYLSFILYYLNGSENKKIIQSLRTLCDYLIIELSNQNNPMIIDNYVSQLIRMINTYNVFTYDRFLFIMTFRSYDLNDYQIALKILHALFVKNQDFQTKYNDFVNLWNTHCNENDEWNPIFYATYIRSYPEKFFYEGIKEQLNAQTSDHLINTYYSNMFMRCVSIMDFLNNRYIELNYQLNEADSLLDNLNSLYKFHNNPISFVYNSLIYYNSKFEALNFTNNSKKKRLFFILSTHQKQNISHFTATFQNYLNSVNGMEYQNFSPPDIANSIDTNYYYLLIQRIVKRMLDNDPHSEFNVLKSEFKNPSCHLLYYSLCELICLELFSNDSKTLSNSICTNIINLFLLGRFPNSQYAINRNEYVYWINAAGIIIASLPEPYWYPVYDLLAETMKTDELLNTTEPSNDANYLLEHFDLFLADQKNIVTPTTLIVTLFHSIWCHSSANHFYYFIKTFIKEKRSELVKTESHFLFICKLIGPFLSKIHLENTNLLIDLAQELYDMIHQVDKLNKNLYYMETICNFFYHLKYRHIGESIKEKIHSLMPDFRPELKTQFKYITSELNQLQQPQHRKKDT